MKKDNTKFWIITVALFVVYFYIFKHTLGRIMPINAIGNMITILFLVGVNIPLLVFSAENLIEAIKKM